MDVSIITINYNSSEHTVRCVNSIIQKVSNAITFEIIVVDNNSDSQDFKFLKKHLPKQNNIQLHRSRQNLGFGGGNNFGVNYAQGKYYLFINNDSELLENSVDALYQYMQKYPKVGVIGPRIVASDNNFLHGYGHFHNIKLHFIGRKLYEKWANKNDPGVDTRNVLNIDFIVGSLMCFRAHAFDEIGGFDSNIFLYYEEMDICLRLKKAGYERVYYPLTTYRHHQGKSSLSINKRIKVLKEQRISYHYFFRKHYGNFLHFILFYWVLIKYPFKILMNYRDYFPLFLFHIAGNPMSRSLKQEQEIGSLDE